MPIRSVQNPLSMVFSGMTDTGFAKLTEGQIDCLRLVLAHLNSKEISRELGVSPHTVDQRLRGAMRVLGATSRFEAARKFAEHEGGDPYQPLIYQSSDVEKSAESDSLGSSAKRRKDVDESPAMRGSSVENGAAIFDIDQRLSRTAWLPFPRYRGEKNNLSAAERLGWIVLIAIGAALSFGGILAGLEALSRLRG